MTDVVDNATRSRMMAGIKNKNTKPELIVRKYLHLHGFRFRLHVADLPGKPDLVLPKHNLVIFVHGCFWHRHAGCYYATSPATRSEFWNNKLTENQLRDTRHKEQLLDQGWRVLTIWECGLRYQANNMQTILSAIVAGPAYCEWPSAPVRLRSNT